MTKNNDQGCYNMSEQGQTDICLSDSVPSERELSQQGIITYPDWWKCQYAYLYHTLYTPTPFVNCRVGPVKGPWSSYSHPIIHGNLPFNSMLYVQLQIVLLYSQEHEVNNAARERIGCLFNKFTTLLVRFVHSCKTSMSIVHAS